MDAKAFLRLPEDVLLVPAARLPSALRRRLRHHPGDRAITRPGLRSSTHLVDAEAAVLLEAFRVPCTLVEAVLRYCGPRHLDPEAVLEEAYPLVADLFTAGLLVAEGDTERSGLLPTLEAGEIFAGFEIVHCERVSPEMELYQVRREEVFAALRIERIAGGLGGDAIQKEATILRALRGQGAPRLLGAGRRQGRRFLAADWCPGFPAGKAAAELRAAGDRSGLRALCKTVSQAYERLHAAGVLHGAVQPSHVLIVGGQARLIDFKQASRESDPATGEQQAVAHLLDVLGQNAPETLSRPRASALIERTLEHLRHAGASMPTPPSPGCYGISLGLAGMALGLVHLARARRDGSLLAAADLRITTADPRKGRGEFPEPDGVISPFLSASGLPAVEALAAAAAGDRGRLERAVGRFAAAARSPCSNPDLYGGRAGLLLACSLLHEVCPVAELRALGEEIAASLWQELDGLPAIRPQTRQPNLGIAHGWAGFLYSTLSFHRATGSPLPPRLPERLRELAELAVPWERGLRWRWQTIAGPWPGPMPTMAGWCNGSAGMVFLWSLAHRVLGNADWLRLAVGAAWDAWDAPVPPTAGGLCCGLAGRAYALLHLYRLGEGRVWLERARELARRAEEEIAHSPEPRDSLYRGELGVAVLTADLEHPEEARMPFFEAGD